MRHLILLVAFSVIVSLPGLGQAFTVSGTYDSTEGLLKLRQQGDRVVGHYNKDNGELTGVLYDRTLDGFWIEDNSGRRCSTPKNGRYYWGRISLEFTGDGFTGQWGYCNDAPTNPWNGTLTSRASSSPPPPPQRDTADPFVSSSDLNIEGTWSSSEGEIRFRQHGSRVNGRYAKDNGEIVGNLSNSTLRGYWIEDSSNRRCGTAKNGRYYWGALELQFDGDRFTGHWGYCGDAPTQSWTGQRH